MTDHADSDHVAQENASDLHRVTSPMQEYSMGQVGFGVAVLVVGLLLTFGLAFGLVGF